MATDPFADNPIVLTEVERDAIQAWFDQVKSLLALSDHEIRVTRRAAEKGATASSHHRDHAIEMVVALKSSPTDWSEPELRQTLTHELLHAHFQPVTRLVEELLEGELGHRAEAIFETAVAAIEELTIDRLATAIARFLPEVVVPPAPASDGA